MNILPRDKRIVVISALTEGCSIRAFERLTGIHRDTIMRLGVRVGNGCAELHDEMMRRVQVNRMELDEAVELRRQEAKKSEADRRQRLLDDQYVFIAHRRGRKAIISYRVGRRRPRILVCFWPIYAERVIGARDFVGWLPPYPVAVELAFGVDCHCGQVVSSTMANGAVDARRALLARRR